MLVVLDVSLIISYSVKCYQLAYFHCRSRLSHYQPSSAASTKEVILGTENGQLHEMAVDEKDKREKYIKFLFELTELPEAFTGLQVSLSSIMLEVLIWVLQFCILFYLSVNDVLILLLF